MTSGPETDIKVFATGLGFGILLDATVVRMLLVPALVSLFGERNWYLRNPSPAFSASGSRTNKLSVPSKSHPKPRRYERTLEITSRRSRSPRIRWKSPPP